MSRTRPQPQTVFVVVGLLAGLCFALLTPPLGGADEPAHWYRAYQVSEGGWRAVRTEDRAGGWLPRRASEIRAAAPSPLDDRIFIDFRKTAVFTPVPYLPLAMAIGVGRGLGLPPLGLLYAARLAGLACALAVVWLAIRTTPIAKHLFVLVALTPMAIRQMSVMSADSVTNAVALLLLALCLRLALDPGTAATPARLTWLLLCSLAVSLAKIAYAPLALLCLLCPASKLGGRRRAVGILAGLIGVNALAVAAWLWLARDLYVAQAIAPDADPSRQLAFIAAEPLRYARVLVHDLHQHAHEYLMSGLGYSGKIPVQLGWLAVVVMSAVAAVDAHPNRSIDWRRKLVLASVAGLTYALVQTLNYMGWNPVGSAAIQFVQGRYYIPLLPLLFLLLSNRRLAGAIDGRRLTTLSAVWASATAIAAVCYLVQRWYGA